MSGKNKEFMTSRQAAEELGVALSTIQLWANNGLLKAWTTGGGHRRIARSSVEAMLSQQRQALSGEPVPEQTEGTDNATVDQLKIVIVEDLPAHRRLYEQHFAARSLPVELIFAKNGYEGLIQIGQHSPDVIISDLMMPNMDGFKMIDALADTPVLGNTLIIVVSGLTDEEIDDRGGLPNQVVRLIKPVPFDRLEEIIREKLQSAVAA